MSFIFLCDISAAFPHTHPYRAVSQSTYFTVTVAANNKNVDDYWWGEIKYVFQIILDNSRITISQTTNPYVAVDFASL